MRPLPLLRKMKYEVIIFAVLIVQAAFSLMGTRGIPVNFLTFYLPDYSLGLIPRAFVGSIVHLLTKTVTEKWLTGFILLTFLLVYTILALLLGRLLRCVPAEQKSATVFLIAVFLFTSYSVKIFIRNVGLLDIYMFLFVLLAAVCLKNRFAKWLIPLFCLAGVAVHYSFAMMFFPLIFTILVYEASLSETKQKRGALVLCAVSVAATLVAALYFLLFSNGNMRLDSDATFAYLQNKANFPVWRYFIDGIYFYTNAYTGQDVSGFTGLLEVLKATAVESFRFENLTTGVVMMAPLFVLFMVIWRNAVKHSTQKMEKAVFFLCAALPLPFLPWFVVSTDMPRLLGELFVVQFCALFYFMADSNAPVTASLEKAETYFRKNPLMALLLLIFSLSAFYYK